MSTVRLDLKAMRKRRLPGVRPSIGSPNGFRLSRRELLGLSGASAATLSPAIRVLGDSLRGPFEMTNEPGRVAFKLSGQEKWVIDASRFGGAPKLKVEESACAVRIELSGARYPGTDLPADFTCELKRGTIGWKMNLQMVLGGFKSDAKFERWLAGLDPAASTVRLRANEFDLNERYRFRLSGDGRAEFHPDWSLSMEGKSLGAVRTPDAVLAAGALHLSMLGAEDSSLLTNPDARRTLITLDRGSEEWPFRAALQVPGTGNLVHPDNSFDTIRVECSENGTGKVRRAFLAESTSSSATMRFQPGEKVTGEGGAPFAIGLRNARYAIAFDEGAERHALFADYEAAPRWLHTDGCSVMVGDGEGARPFELTGTPERTRTLFAAPALLSFAAPLEGAIVSHSPIEAGTSIELASYGVTPPDVLDRGTHLRQSAKSIAVRMILGRNQSIQVTRPDDMLALEFEFVNLGFRSGAGGATLARNDPNQGAFLIVHFPPQNIAEQAFFEVQAGSGPQSGGEMPTSLPVQSRLAGPSRLAFFVPNTVQSIPYTVAGLLDWTKLQPSVVPVAAPPPAPFILFNELQTGIGLANLTTVGKAAVDDSDMIRIKKSQRVYHKKGLDLQKAAPPAAPKIDAAALLQNVQKSPAGVDVAAKLTANLVVIPKIRQPLGTETAIEAPWRVVLSPHSYSAWSHAPLPVTHEGRTELWHTRLAVARNGKPDESDVYYRSVRAVWSPDYSEAPATPSAVPHFASPGSGKNPFRTSLDASDRNEIVRLSSDFQDLRMTGKAFQPRHIPVDHLMLSPLGAFVDLDGTWDPPDGFSVQEWKHRATMGRDHYVKVVYAGYLMPFGHKASLIKITERKIVMVSGERVALNRQRMFIVVREEEKTYSANDSLLQFNGRQNPFTDVHILTRITPLLDDPTGAGSSIAGQNAFWPRVAGEDFRFTLNGLDRDGRQSQFTMPMAFIAKNIADIPREANMIIDRYNKADEATRRRAVITGPKLAFGAERSPKDPKIPSDTHLETDWISWFSQPPTKPVVNRAPFYPAMQAADVKVPALRTMADHNEGSQVVYTDQYLNSGFGPGNPGEVYVALRNAAVPVSFGKGGNADKSGGLASPNIQMTAMSRRYGPVGGSAGKKVASLARWEEACAGVNGDAEPPDDGWAFDPKSFFTSDAMMLGGIELIKLIGNALPNDGGKQVPKITTEDKPPNDIKASIDWAPEIFDIGDRGAKYPDDATGLFIAKDKKNCFSLHAEISVKRPMTVPTGDGVTAEQQAQAVKDIMATKDSAPPMPTYKIEGKLEDFVMGLFGCIKIHFDHFYFTSTPEEKFKPDPKFNKDDGIKFMGALSFVNDLKNIIPGMGGSSKGMMADLDVTSKNAVCAPNVGGFEIGPYIDPYAIGLKAGIKIGIPTISVGVFSLQNIKVVAGIDLPFTGDPVMFIFKFCSADDPFLLTVWIIGGGGYLELEVGAHGLESLTANFQLGAMASIDIGIASGGVYIKMGFTYAYGDLPDSTTTPKQKGSTLTGYVQAGGYVNVLGIISLSLELYLGLTYQEYADGSNALWGRASIEFHVSILFFSFTVSAEVEKTFSGTRKGSAALDRGIRLASLNIPSGLEFANALPGASGPVAFKDAVEEPDWNEYCAAFAFA